MADYRYENVCPRCGGGVPDCTRPGFNHDECRRIRWSDGLCDRCKETP